MNREVNYEAIWKKVTDGLSDKEIKIKGKKAIKKLKKIAPYDYNAGMAYIQCNLELIEVDKINEDVKDRVFEWVYFYRNAKRPNFILTLIKKYLY